MEFYSLLTFMLAIALVPVIKGELKCKLFARVPTVLYDSLQCKYIKEQVSDVCYIRYDCGNIYNRPNNTCHFKGKLYKVDQEIDEVDLSSVYDAYCFCGSNSDITCPEVADGCAVDWLGLEPGCYRRHILNQYCDSQQCPPFDDIAKCGVNGVSYREGDLFDHPNKKCTKCVCEKGFTLETPFCRQVNCTDEFRHFKEINNYCAPFYDHKEDTCCPTAWICPSEKGVYHESPVSSDLNLSDFQCKFGNRVFRLHDYYVHEDKTLGSVTCSCDVPPLLYCTVNPKQSIVPN